MNDIQTIFKKSFNFASTASGKNNLPLIHLGKNESIVTGSELDF